MRAFTEAVRGELSSRQQTVGAPPPARDLRRQLARERARNAGLEQGIAALHDRVRALRAELSELRAETT